MRDYHAITFIIAILVAWAGHALRAQAPDIQPFPGQKLYDKKVTAWDEFEIPIGPVKDGKVSKTDHVEGKITYYDYTNPDGQSMLEIYRNWEQGMKQAGFEAIFVCHGRYGKYGKDDCGDTQVHSNSIGYFPYSNDDRYMAAKLTRAGQTTYAILWVPGGHTYVWFIEPKAMATGQVQLTAGKLEDDITAQGHASIYGINFDTGKAEIKPQSEPVLKTIAELLKKDPKLKIHVIGHTDNVGQLAMNMDLSKRRAQAVAAELQKTYGIETARLHADGVGPLAPVATNRTEEGRAKNRRVELVEQ
jgi:OOP family OmpA-OmpF porin